MPETLVKITALIAVALTINGFAAQTKHASKAKHPAPPKVEHLAALPSTVDLGVFDNSHQFDNVRTITYELGWYRWENTPSKLLPQLQQTTAKGRIPLLTVEPNPITTIGNAKTLLPDIAAGKYDAVIRNLAKTIRSLGSPVLVRFAPEMECVTVRPWSMQEPVDYIAAFRRFVTTFKQVSPSSLIVWSPIGEGRLALKLLVTDVATSSTSGLSHSSVEYYPGDDVVDYTGCSIYEICTMSVIWVGHEQSFSDWMTKRYALLAQFNKPIIVTELGICDTPEKQKAWMEAAFASVGDFPLVRTLVYYSAQDANSWNLPTGLKHPDWSIDPAIFNN